MNTQCIGACVPHRNSIQEVETQKLMEHLDKQSQQEIKNGDFGFFNGSGHIPVLFIKERDWKEECIFVDLKSMRTDISMNQDYCKMYFTKLGNIFDSLLELNLPKQMTLEQEENILSQFSIFLPLNKNIGVVPVEVKRIEGESK